MGAVSKLKEVVGTVGLYVGTIVLLCVLLAVAVSVIVVLYCGKKYDDDLIQKCLEKGGKVEYRPASGAAGREFGMRHPQCSPP
jgi:hypothetical protein